MGKSVYLIVVCLLLLVQLVQSANGNVVEGRMASEILGTEKAYSVYLPAGYENLDVTYPVLYLLHGAWGNHTDWVKAGNMVFLANQAISEGLALPMIIVMPDARGMNENGAGKNMGYFNLPDWRYEDFFIREFIPEVESKFRIRRDKQHRAIAGLSMGGGGTVLFAQHYPELFSSACPLSALLAYAQEVPDNDITLEFIQAAQKHNAVDFVRTADEETLTALRTIRWYVDCGDDDFLYKGNIHFYEAMKEKQIPLEYRMRNGGHTWEYWQTALPSVLQFVSIGFAIDI